MTTGGIMALIMSGHGSWVLVIHHSSLVTGYLIIGIEMGHWAMVMDHG
jgi:hypothetical protein